MNEGAGAIVNFFLSFYDMIILIGNFFVPLSWIASDFFYRLGASLVKLVNDVAGFTKDPSVGEPGRIRDLQDDINDNPIFSGVANDFLPVGSSQLEQYEAAITVFGSICSLFGDIVIIMSYAYMEMDEARVYEPIAIFPDVDNKLIK